MWTETGKGIFVPGTNTIDALIDITKKVQAAVFIFNVDDTTWNENSALEEAKTVRDNVLFEYGLFTGALGKNKVCFVCKGRPKVASIYSLNRFKRNNIHRWGSKVSFGKK